MLEEYDFTNARKNPYIQREGGAADEQEDEYSRLAGSLQPVASGGAEGRPAQVFYSSTPGRTGQREANRKADAWLEDGIGVKVGRVEDVYKLWLDGLKQTTSAGNWEPIESRWRIWVLPIIGKSGSMPLPMPTYRPS